MSSPKLTASCIITNYNYAEFVIEALNSVVSQTVPFDQVIIVDDCSSDSSLERLAEFKQRFDFIDVVKHQSNQGQLAAFESGFNNVSSDLVFFLDADDVYAPVYLEHAKHVYSSQEKCDFLFCQNTVFEGDEYSSGSAPSNIDDKLSDVDRLGFSVISTLIDRPYIGAPTSCLSMTREILEKILPIHYHEDWVTRADDVLVFGASLAGAQKFRLNRSYVGYRKHVSNAFLGKNIGANAIDFYWRSINVSKLFSLLQTKLGMPDDIRSLSHLEFKTLNRPTFAVMCKYITYTVKYGGQHTSRLKAVLLILKCFIRRNEHN